MPNSLALYMTDVLIYEIFSDISFKLEMVYKNGEVSGVGMSMVFQIDEGENEQHLRRQLLLRTFQQEQEFTQRHELAHTSATLTQEQIFKMMQVIEEIRLKRYEETL